MMNTHSTTFPIGDRRSAQLVPTIADQWARRTHAPHGSFMHASPDPDEVPDPTPVREPHPKSPPVKEPNTNPEKQPPATPPERPADPRPTPNNPPDIKADNDDRARRSIPGAEPRVVNDGPESDTDPSKGDYLDPQRKDR